MRPIGCGDANEKEPGSGGPWPARGTKAAECAALRATCGFDTTSEPCEALGARPDGPRTLCPGRGSSPRSGIQNGNRRARRPASNLLNTRFARAASNSLRYPASVPEGHLIVARRFNAGISPQTIPVPKGRLKTKGRFGRPGNLRPARHCTRCGIEPGGSPRLTGHAKPLPRACGENSTIGAGP